MVDFKPWQLEHFANIACERANMDAALRYPEGRKREDEIKRLTHRYYAEYVTPPLGPTPPMPLPGDGKEGL